MTRGLALLYLVSLLVSVQSVSAQITYDGCRDFRGISVASVVNQSISDVATAQYAYNGAPIIIYNPVVLSWLQPQTRVFFYAHECAHHALAHLANRPPNMEQDADCWAVRTLVSNGIIGLNDVRIIQGDIARFGQGDWSHLPGPARAINLQACLGW
jgi:hypothetical protein